MKQLVLASLVVIALLSACEKSSDDPSSSNTITPPTSSTGLSFKVGGTLITADSVKATLYTLFISPFNREIDIYGYKAGNVIFEGHFIPRTGTQNVAANMNDAWLSYVQYTAGIPTGSYDGSSGTLTLTVCDTVANKIEGTFAFTGRSMFDTTQTISLSEGKIAITSIQKQ